MPRARACRSCSSSRTDLDQIWADERAIRQICLNLMSNALKFTPRGGRITLSVSHDAGRRADAERASDTGPGIPKEEIPRVMQAFGQGSLAHQTAEGGTGLGLPIVQNLVSLHGGTFELRSELRKGTEAVVILPRSRVLRSHAAVAAARARSATAGRPADLARPLSRAGRADDLSLACRRIHSGAVKRIVSEAPPSYISPACGRTTPPSRRFGTVHGNALHQCVRDRRDNGIVRGLQPINR